MFNDTEDQAWMSRIAAGDRSAFEALYRAYASALGNYLFRICYEESLAEDGLQETFLRVWRAAPQWRGQGKVSTFLFQVAKNVGLDVRSRRLREQARMEDPDDESRPDPETGVPAPDRAMEGAELRDLVRRAVASLPDEQRMVLELVQTEGLTYREAAEILDLPLGTVKSRMLAAAETLRRRLLRHVKG
jgi:RNA polymerase sigma-70 factor (ECF subfamily)